MSRYLQSFLDTMPSIQRDIMNEMIERNQEAGINNFEEEIQELIQYITEENEVHFKARAQKERSDSQSYNDNLKEIQYDLEALFKLSGIVEQFSDRNFDMSESLIKEIDKKIAEMRKKIHRYHLLKKTNDKFHHVVIEDFTSPALTETNESLLKGLRTDRSGRRKRKELNAEAIHNKLQIPSSFAEDQLTTNYGRPMGKIKVRNRLGRVTHEDRHPIEHAIDGSRESFWSELVLTDEPIVQENPRAWSQSYYDYPTEGAVCEIEIDFFHTAVISEFTFEPYGHYPLEIISAYAYEREDFEGEVHELVSPNQSNLSRKSASSTDAMTFQFPSVHARKVRLLIRQENYTRENFLLNVEDKRNLDLWEKLSRESNEIEDLKDPDETMASFDTKNEITGWTTYLNELSSWGKEQGDETLVDQAKKAMKIVKMGDYKNPLLLYLQSLEGEASEEGPGDQFQAMSKLAYLYGARRIRFQGREFRSEGIYISKEIDIPASAKEITLRTIEDHPEVDLMREKSQYQNTQKITDIEYYITTKAAPSQRDWVSILPVQKKFVEAEHLYIDDVQRTDQAFMELIESGEDLVVFSLRFKSVSNDTIVIKRNGMEVPRDHFVISDDGRKIAILERYYSASSTYTADYMPDQSAFIHEIEESEEPSLYMDDNGEVGQFFKESNYDNRITLKHLPYIHRVHMFEETSEGYGEKEEGMYPLQILVDGVPFENITDYRMNQYDEEDLKKNNGRSFAQIGKEIIFGRPQGESIRNIQVDYYHTNNKIRLKAVLKRNQLNFLNITPSLFEYEIRSSHKGMEDTQ